MGTREIIPADKKLFPYQEQGVKLLLRRSRSLLADEMGLGKTVQVVVYANVITPQRIVIITTTGSKHVWENEFLDWGMYPRNIQLIHDGKTVILPETDTVILSYGLASKSYWRSFIKSFIKNKSSLIICDEAHNLRRWEADRTTNILLDIWPCFDKGILITGSPMLRNITDLHPLFSACDPDLWGDYEYFCNRYSFPVYNAYKPNKKDYRGTRNIPELKKKAKSFMIRRFKKDVQKDLPDKLFSNIYLDVKTPELPDSMKEAAIKTAAMVAAGKDFVPQASLAGQRRQDTLTKLPEALKWLDEYLEQKPDEPLIIYAHHHAVIEQLEDWADKHNLTYTTITGKTPPKQRGEKVKEFQSGKVQLFFGNIQAAGVAITLTRASVVIFVELDYTPELISQAIDRAHRIGQRNTVNVYFLLAKNTVDDILINVIREKLKTFKKILSKKALEDTATTNNEETTRLVPAITRS